MYEDERITLLTQAVRELANALVSVHGHAAVWEPGSGSAEHEETVRRHANRALAILREMEQGPPL